MRARARRRSREPILRTTDPRVAPALVAKFNSPCTWNSAWLVDGLSTGTVLPLALSRHSPSTWYLKAPEAARIGA